jgi:hypothetical protein
MGLVGAAPDWRVRRWAASCSLPLPQDWLPAARRRREACSKTRLCRSAVSTHDGATASPTTACMPAHCRACCCRQCHPVTMMHSGLQLGGSPRGRGWQLWCTAPVTQATITVTWVCLPLSPWLCSSRLIVARAATLPLAVPGPGMETGSPASLPLAGRAAISPALCWGPQQQHDRVLIGFINVPAANTRNNPMNYS